MFKQKVILNKSECEQIINLCDDFHQSKVYDWKTNTGKVNKQKRNSEEAYFFDLDSLKKIVIPKLKEFNIKNLPDKTKVLRYKKGCFFTPHRDKRAGALEHRKLTLIIQLSESTDYTEGKLIVDNQTASKEIGTLILFDSTLIHQVTELIDGERLALVSWIRDEDMIVEKKTLV